MTDRVCNLKVHICLFIAEHDLLFTMSQPLVDLVRSVAEDQSTSAHASYFCTHGIAAQDQTELATKFQRKLFSLNADEATNANMDKILNVLVRYFDEDMGKVLTQHLALKKVNIADATTLTNTLTDILQSKGLKCDELCMFC